MITIASTLQRKTALAAAVLLASCAQLPEPRMTDVRVAMETAAGMPALHAANVEVREGIAHLGAGRLAEASAVFNSALARDPRNANLHVLAALAYHLMFLRGESQRQELAETGYLLALELEPANVVASLQLGRLYLRLGRHAEAKQRFLAALEQPGGGEAWHDLAVAAYNVGDIDTALNAVRAMQQRQTIVTLESVRTASLIKAAGGLGAEARRDLDAFVPGGADAGLVEHLRTRIAELSQPAPMMTPMREEMPTPKPRTESDAGDAAKARAVKTPPTAGPVAPDWADCAPERSSEEGRRRSMDSGEGGRGSQPDDFSPLPALPSPCIGKGAPRMAVIEAVLVLYDQQSSSSSGINLLDGLQFVLSGGRGMTRASAYDNLTGTQTASTVARTITRGVGLPAAGITYALNIASAARQRNEVVSRPSLLVLDRRPSTLFSGISISVALQGNAVSGGSIQDKPIGSGLAVTPTFIDDNRMLLAVRVTSSSISSGTTSPFGPGSLSTLRSSFTSHAQVGFDQTIILSGIDLVESERTKSGVPVLQDIPGTQYFFSNARERDRRVSALILLTPRRLSPADATPAAEVSRDNPGGAALADLDRMAAADPALPPNIRSSIGNLQAMRHWKQIRQGDVRSEAWAAEGRLKQLLWQIERFIYY